MTVPKVLMATAIMAFALSGCGEAGGGASGLMGDESTFAEAGSGTIDFGNNSSEWANDDECDDPRFEGSAMATILNTDYIGRDAADCQAAFEAGNVTLSAFYEEPSSIDAINYGDDEGSHPNDAECDDIRFTGAYAANLVFLPENIGHDASDCRAAVEAGEATWQGATATPEYGVTLEELEAEAN